MKPSRQIVICSSLKFAHVTKVNDCCDIFLIQILTVPFRKVVATPQRGACPSPLDVSQQGSWCLWLMLDGAFALHADKRGGVPISFSTEFYSRTDGIMCWPPSKFWHLGGNRPPQNFTVCQAVVSILHVTRCKFCGELSSDNNKTWVVSQTKFTCDLFTSAANMMRNMLWARLSP